MQWRSKWRYRIGYGALKMGFLLLLLSPPHSLLRTTATRPTSAAAALPEGAVATPFLFNSSSTRSATFSQWHHSVLLALLSLVCALATCAFLCLQGSDPGFLDEGTLLYIVV